MKNLILSVVTYFICILIFKYMNSDDMQNMVLGSILLFSIKNNLDITDLIKKLNET